MNNLPPSKKTIKRPSKDKKLITITVSLFEAAMIYKLRQYPFGQFTIHKADDEPRRVTFGASEMIKEEDALKLLQQSIEEQK